MKSLSAKLTAMILAISLVGMGLLAGTGVLLSRNSVIEETLESISHNTAREAERINGWLEQHVSYIDSLAIEYAYIEDYSDEAMLPRFNSHVDGTEAYFDVYMGYPDGRVTFASGFQPDYAAGWRSTLRPWYIGAMEVPGETHITPLYTDVQTGELCLTVAKAVFKDGAVVGVVSADILIGALTDIVYQADVGQDSYAFLLDSDGGILIHPNDAYGPDADDNFQRFDEIEDGVYAGIGGQDGAVKLRGADGISRYYTAREIEATGWILYTVIPVSVVEEPIRSLLFAELAIFVLVVAVASLLMSWSVKRMVVRPIADLTRAAGELTRGSVDIAIDADYNDEIGELIRSFIGMAQSIREQVSATERLAAGDLSGQVEVRSDADVMGQALRGLNASLGDFIRRIAEAAERVSSGSSQISNSTQLLAEGASRQAATVQQIFTSVSDMLGQIRHTEDIVREASEASETIVENAKEGTERVERMIGAVEDINAASSRISNVIGVIEDIAFQTNILALNAAVEAARAGQHGKGFAVVADEVRRLASKSAEAARETDALIKDSIGQAAYGSQVATETGESLRDILSGVDDIFRLVEQISEATRGQAGLVDSIHGGIEQINDVVSENAATAQQCAAAVANLSHEATAMMDIVHRFSGGQKISPTGVLGSTGLSEGGISSSNDTPG